MDADRENFFREQNRLLAALPEAEYQRLRPQMDLVRLASGQILHEFGEPFSHAFFPASCAVSLLKVLEDGSSTGIAFVGSESLIGVSLLLEGGTGASPPYRAVVQNAGYAYRMRADSVIREFQRGGAFQHSVLRATQAMIMQIAQFTVCSKFHPLSKRLCTWLLHSLDHNRMAGNELSITQTALSCVLGVRREGVTQAATRLRFAGVIDKGRGRIHVKDRSALERQACECYSLVSRECKRLSPAPVGAASGLSATLSAAACQ